MKLNIQTQVDVEFVKIEVPVRYEEEQIPNDFPLRKGNMWSCTVDIETGCILEWPNGQAEILHLKVVDEGVYTLLNENKEKVHKLDGDYVPHGLIPGEYGDYIQLDIDYNGRIKNWPTRPSLEDFEQN